MLSYIICLLQIYFVDFDIYYINLNDYIVLTRKKMKLKNNIMINKRLRLLNAKKKKWIKTAIKVSLLSNYYNIIKCH